MEWHIILIAVAVSASMHTAAEPQNVLFKLQRLYEAIKTGKVMTPPMKGIDTRAKSYAVGVAFLVVPAAITYLIANAVDPSVEAAIQFSIAVIVVAELILMVRLDTYHVQIEKMTSELKKKK